MTGQSVGYEQVSTFANNCIIPLQHLPAQLSEALFTKTGSEGAAEARPKTARAGKMNFMAKEY